MALLLKNYDAKPRLAVVRTDAGTAEKDCEYAIQSGKGLRFMPDGAYFELTDQGAGLPELFRDGDIITINRYGLIRKQYDHSEREATVFITGQCNSNCIMCPDSDAARQRNTGFSEEWLFRYIAMLPSDITHLVVTGGEPTLRTETFLRAMQLLADRFCETECLLLSNGRSFASKKLTERLLSYCPQYLTVAVPVHGHAADLHDYITRAEGSFRQTFAGIKHLLAHKVAVEIRIVVSKLNYKYLTDIAELIVSEFPTAAIVNLIGLETLGNCAKNLSSVFIDYAASFPYIKDALLVLLKAGMNASIYNYPLCMVERGFWSLCQRSITPSKIVYPHECARCDAKKYCSGFFGSTFSVTHPRVTPITLHE